MPALHQNEDCVCVCVYMFKSEDRLAKLMSVDELN